MDLPEYLRTRFPNQSVAAKALAVSQGTISHWITGRRRPSPAKALEIVRLSGGKVSFAHIYAERAQ